MGLLNYFRYLIIKHKMEMSKELNVHGRFSYLNVCTN